MLVPGACGPRVCRWAAFRLLCVSPVQVSVIPAAGPVEHASHMAAQPQFVHPEHRAFVDLSGHNLASPHPFAGRTAGQKQGHLRRSWWGPPSRVLPEAQPRSEQPPPGSAILCLPRGTKAPAGQPGASAGLEAGAETFLPFLPVLWGQSRCVCTGRGGRRQPHRPVSPRLQ